VDLGTHLTQSPTGGIWRLATSREGWRTATFIALVLICFATAVLAGAALALLRFGGHYTANIRWAMYCATISPVLFLLWGAYFVYVPATTVLEFSSVSLRLTRSLPFRAWSGPWRDVRRAYLHKGLLAIRTPERVWPAWAVRVTASDALLVEEFKRNLGPGVWRDPVARLRRAARVLVIIHAILLMLAVLVGLIEKAFR